MDFCLSLKCAKKGSTKLPLTLPEFYGGTPGNVTYFTWPLIIVQFYLQGNKAQHSNDDPIKDVYQGESADEVPPITERVQDIRPEELIRRKKNVDSNWETRPETTEALGESSIRKAENQSRFFS